MTSSANALRPPPVRAILLALPAEHRLPALEADLRQRVANVLQLSPAALDRDRKLTGLGLDSLTAVEIKHEVESALGVDLPLADLIEGPSLAELAVDLIRRISGEAPAAELPVPGDFAASRSGAGWEGEGPLSHGQRALWFVEGLAASAIYNVPAAARVRGPLDLPALRRACERLVDRHPALRTTFGDVRGEPRQRVHPQLPPGFAVEEATGWDGDRLAQRLAALAGRPFDLAAGPLVRLHAFPVGVEETIVLLVIHHLVVDFWSMANLVRDLDLLYREERAGTADTGGARAALPPLPLAYGDYVAWQERLLAGPAGEELWEAWRRELAGEPPTLDMPADRPRPPVQTYNGAARLHRLPAAATAALHELTRAADATLFATLLAAWQALLGRSSGQREVWVGSPTLGRPRAELLDLVGYFVNPVVLRGNLAGDPSFAALLAAARGTVARALRHQDFPFPLLTERLKPARDPARSPLFQAMLVYQQAPRAADPALAAFGLGPGPRLRLGDLILESEPLAWRAAYFDLNLIAAEVDDRLWLSLEYNTDLYDGTTAERLLAHLAVLLAGATAAPRERLGGFPLLAAAERQQALYEWAAGPGDSEAGETTVHALFEAQAARTPDAISVVAQGEALSYRELDASADRVARLLARRGVGPEVRVALHLERNVHLLVGLFGILKAGGAYVPVDPAYPVARKRFLLDDAGAPVVVTQTSLARELRLDGVAVLCLDQEAVHRQPAGRLNRRPTPGNPAYVIYTSGSTGKPKGVAIEHRSIATYAAVAAAEFALAPGDRMLQFTSISFDICGEEIYPTLACGATLVLRNEEMLASVGDFLRTAERWELTLLDLPTAYWHEICAALARERLALPPVPPALRLVIVAGEQALRDRLETWRQAAISAAISAGAGTPVPVINTYGPTEATIVATWCEICRATAGSDPDLQVPIGRPIPGAAAYVLDRDLAPLPIGTAGELFLGGFGIARGYHQRPDGTALRFLPDPFAEQPGARLYRTGDLARHRADGTLEFLGRVDEQVKVRGFRIELAEIESALREHPGVAEGVVLAPVEASGSRRLVAYVVAESGAAPSVAALREHLAERLPDYMVPTSWRFLAALPLTPNGKIDRQAISAIAVSAEEEPGAARASRPATPMEEVVAGIWEEVLERERVHPDDNFFEIGGHSLLATRVLSRLREVVRVELLPSQMFQQPTVAGLAQLLEAAGRLAPLPQAPPLRPVSGAPEEPLPLSFAQERLWFLDRMEPGNPWYNVPAAVHLRGRLDPVALAGSLTEVVRRHAVLRTHFASGEAGPVLVVTPPAPFPLPVVDLAALPAAVRAAVALRLAAEEGRRPFDLARGWMVRALLLEEGARAATALVIMHHIASDGWSLVLFIRELSALYGALTAPIPGTASAADTAGQPAPLPELPIQYADFARWQRRWLTGEVLDAQLAHWREALAGAPLLLDLPTDRPRGAEQSTRGARLGFTLPPSLERDLRALARGQGATLFMILLAAFQAYLGRSANQEDILTGVPIAGRTHRELEGLIGLFVNTLVLRARLAGAPSFAELLARVRSAALAAYAYQDLPFERVVEDLHPERSLAYAPLFQVMFAYENAPEAALRLGDLELDLVELETGTAKFDLHLTVMEGSAGSGGLAGHLEYRIDLFDPGTAGRMLAGWTTLLSEAVAQPERPVGEIPLLSAAERRELAHWNATAVARPAGLCLHHLFEAQVARTPEAVALTFADASLSYGELDRAAGRLAGRLRRLGVGPEVVVGLFAERSLEMMVAILAILKAGGAYLPLDTGSPAERLAFMLEDARVPVVVVQRLLAGRLPAFGGERVLVDPTPDPAPEAPESLLPVAVDPDNLAYVLFTSGSTGRPKGVMSRHAGVVNRLLWVEEIRPTPADCFLQKSPYGFDVSLWEMFWPLATGGRLVVALPGGHQDPAYLARTAAREGITVLQFVTSMLRAFLEEPETRGLSALRQVIESGEALPPDVARRFSERLPGAVLSNLYGPTEASIEVTWWHCPPGDGRAVVPIGRPVANTQIHLQDQNGGAVPVGVHGELLIGGVQIARGYLGRPELTAERFVPDAFSGEPGARVYRSGDRARRLADGTIDYLGRLDDQVKLRGVRIEPGEIAAVLALHPAVRDAVVLPREDRPGDLRLVAYVTLAAGAAGSVDVAALRAGLAEHLPAHLVPADFVVLDQLPLSVAGKVDRRALPAPERPAAGDQQKAASDPVEEILAGIWAEVLGLDRVGVEDNFFALGGHSLVVMRVLARLEEALGVALSPRALFEAPTVAALARTVADLRRTRLDWPPAPPLVRLAGEEREGPLAPSFAQERLWVLDQLLPGSAVYNVSQALRISGSLDLPALARSLREVVRRHEVLRTRFTTVRGRPMQVIEPAPRFDFLCVDLRELPPVAGEREAVRLAHQEARRPFDLRRGPLLRIGVVQASSPIVLFTLHHTVCDDWSVGILVREVAALYGAAIAGRAGRAGLPSPSLPELPVQYADYAAWQREWLAGEVLEGELDFWRRQLAGELPVLALPTDRPRPPVQSYRGARRPFALPKTLVAALDELSRRQGTTLFMTLLAAFAAVLGQCAGQEDVIVGGTIAGRTHRELEGLIGCFVNVLPLRIDLSGRPTYGELLARVRRVVLDAFDHKDVPFEKLVEAVQVERSLAHAALRQVALALQDESMRTIELAEGVAARPLEVESGVARLDLTLFLWRTAEGISGDCEYSTDLFDDATIGRLLGFLDDLLADLAAGVDRPVAALPPLAARENAGAVALPEPPELGEILGVLTRFPGIRTATVVVREDRRGDRRLVAYYVPEPEWGPSAQQLRGYLQRKLPTAPLPHLVALQSMPLEPSGQIDHGALPAPA
jgi:amino acid adenylation domain-containing protein